jgi:hypothetical protein
VSRAKLVATLVAGVCALGVLAAAPAAHAGLTGGVIVRPPPIIILPRPSSGVVSGRLWFYQHQGNFCTPSETRDCTGSRYLSSDYHTNMPVGDVKVFVREGESIIGQGVTDASGYFQIPWWTNHSVSQLNFIWTAEQKDDRFAIRTGGGGTWIMWTYPVDTVWYSADDSPQWLGDFTWGGPGAEHPVANVYDGARRTWNDSLQYSYTMQQRFTGLQVRTTNSSCRTSCADGASNAIDLDPAAPFQPQGRIMHEMGHIASYRGSSNALVTCRDYSWGSVGWALNGPEWGCAAFEEGLATFFGDTALYGANAVNPRTCLSTGECPDSMDIERMPASCPIDTGRWPINIDRALWDQFDIVADRETTSENLWVFVDTLEDYPGGTENHAREEWRGEGGGPDLDGRATFDWMYHYTQKYGGTLFYPVINNCGWIGD